MDRFEKLKKAQELELCTSKQVWEELGDGELDFYTLESWVDAKIALAAVEEGSKAEVERLRVEAQRVPALVDLVEELVPLIGTHYDVPDLLGLADDLTGDVKGERKEGGA